MRKGQVSIEALSAVIILLVAFVFVLIVSAGWNAHSAILEQSYGERNFCINVSMIASKMYSIGPQSQIEFSADYDFNVTKNEIVLASTSCRTISRVQDAVILQGNARAKDLNGTVVFENV